MLAKFRPGHPAMLAGRADFLLDARMGHHEIRQQFVDRRMPRLRHRGHAFALGGALLAQMLLDLLPVLDFRQVNRRGFVAGVALHVINPANPISATARGQCSTGVSLVSFLLLEKITGETPVLLTA
jgi:hypothetical protein